MPAQHTHPSPASISRACTCTLRRHCCCQHVPLIPCVCFCGCRERATALAAAAAFATSIGSPGGAGGDSGGIGMLTRTPSFSFTATASGSGFGTGARPPSQPSLTRAPSSSSLPRPASEPRIGGLSSPLRLDAATIGGGGSSAFGAGGGGASSPSLTSPALFSPGPGGPTTPSQRAWRKGRKGLAVVASGDPSFKVPALTLLTCLYTKGLGGILMDPFRQPEWDGGVVVNVRQAGVIKSATMRSRVNVFDLGALQGGSALEALNVQRRVAEGALAYARDLYLCDTPGVFDHEYVVDMFGEGEPDRELDGELAVGGLARDRGRDSECPFSHCASCAYCAVLWHSPA